MRQAPLPTEQLQLEDHKTVKFRVKKLDSGLVVQRPNDDTRYQHILSHVKKLHLEMAETKRWVQMVANRKRSNSLAGWLAASMILNLILLAFIFYSTLQDSQTSQRTPARTAPVTKTVQ